MPRPTFQPSAEQRATLAALARLAARRAKVEAEVDRLIVQANAQGIPVSHIAESASVQRKTVYKRLEGVAGVEPAD